MSDIVDKNLAGIDPASCGPADQSVSEGHLPGLGKCWRDIVGMS
jgi:hypothetical protein